MPHSKKLVLTLIPMVVIFSFGMDSYIPFVVEIKDELGLSEATVQLSLSIYFLALAFGQIFIGLLSDYIGRKNTLYLSAAVFSLASLFCSLVTSGNALIMGRFVQGLGGCGLRVCAYAVVQDQFDAEKAAANLTVLYSAISLSPMLAPLFGGVVGNLWHWRMIFVMLAILGIILGLFIHNLEETARQVASSSIKKQLVDIITVFRDRNILFFGLVSAAGISVMFCFVSVLSYVVIDQYHLPHIFIYVTFLAAGVGMLTAGRISPVLLRQAGRQRVLMYSFCTNWLLLIMILLLNLFSLFPVAVFYLMLMPLLGISVIINGCAISLGIASRKTLAGLGISIIGVLGYGLASLNGWLLSLVHMDMFAYALVLSSFYTLIIMIYIVYYRVGPQTS